MKNIIWLFVFILSIKPLMAQEKIPFEGLDYTWLNGNDRRDSSVFHNKYFAPSILLDANYTYSFNNPKDNTVVGSTALARNNEMELSGLHFGGDLTFHQLKQVVTEYKFSFHFYTYQKILRVYKNKIAFQQISS